MAGQARIDEVHQGGSPGASQQDAASLQSFLSNIDDSRHLVSVTGLDTGELDYLAEGQAQVTFYVDGHQAAKLSEHFAEIANQHGVLNQRVLEAYQNGYADGRDAEFSRRLEDRQEVAAKLRDVLGSIEA